MPQFERGFPDQAKWAVILLAGGFFFACAGLLGDWHPPTIAA
jgi:hypothetical protein